MDSSSVSRSNSRSSPKNNFIKFAIIFFKGNINELLNYTTKRLITLKIMLQSYYFIFKVYIFFFP